MQYVYLAIAIVLEVIGSTLLGLSDGFTKLLPACLSLVLYGICFYSFSKALQSIDLGIAYATWCSVGIVLTSIISVLAFGQKLTVIGVISLVMIIAGCVLLNLYGSAS